MKNFLKDWGVIILCSAVGLVIGMMFWSGKYNPISMVKRLNVIESELKQQRSDMDSLFENQKMLSNKIDEQPVIIRLEANANTTDTTDTPHDWMNGFPEQQVPISPADGRY